MITAQRRLGWLVGWVLVACVLFSGLALQAGDEEATLPEAAAAAIAQAFDGAAIEEVEAESEHGLKLYEVELLYEGAELEVAVSAEGVIAEVERELDDIPELIEAAIRDAAKGGKVMETEEEEIRAVYIASLGQLCELKEPVVVYEIEFVKDGHEYEARVRADGTLLGIGQEGGDDGDGDDD
jgi:uncharacterized membrane protein YkoI